MSTVLFIKANDRSIEDSVSVKLYSAFTESYKATHAEDQIIELDLFNENLPYMNATMINGIFKAANGYELQADEKGLADIANHYIDQFLAADKIVIGFPLWNMTVPAVLHTYFDYLNQAGKTFKYTAQGPVGIAGDKKVMLLNASGGIYSVGEAQANEMAVNFVARNLALFGINDVTKIIVEGHNQLPDQAASIIQSGLESATEAAKQF